MHALLTLLLAAQTPTAEDDVKALQGPWQVVYAQTDGKPGDPAELLKIVVTIEGKSHKVHVGDQLAAEGVTFEIDPKTNPRSVVDSFNDADGKPHKIRSIYRIVDNDTLISCSSAVDAAAGPDEFNAPAGSGRTFRILRRVGSPEREKAVTEEWKRFEGKWNVKQVKIGGQSAPFDVSEIRLDITPHGRFKYTGPEGSSDGIYVVDLAAKPARMALIHTSGPHTGEAMVGLYSLEGDVYTLAFDPTGTLRPDSLDSKPGTTHIFEVLHRDPKP